MAHQHITLSASPEAIAWLGKEGYDPSFGARPLKRLLQREVTNRLSKEVLAGSVEPGDRVRIEADGDGLKVVKE